MLEKPEDLIGMDLGSITVVPSRFQLAWFADVVGFIDPIYHDVDAAQAAGHRDIVIPPTFYFSLELLHPERGRAQRELGIDQRQVLHGEQSFRYHEMAYAGDELTVTARIADYYTKKGGALRFVRRNCEVFRRDQLIASLSNLLVARDLELV